MQYDDKYTLLQAITGRTIHSFGLTSLKVKLCAKSGFGMVFSDGGLAYTT